MLKLTNNSNRVKLLIGFIISAIFLYLAFRKVNINQLISAFAIINYWYLIPATLVFFLSLWLRAYRWGVFFKPIREMSMKSLYSALLVGYMGNNIFPFKLGEFIRAYYIGKFEGISKTESFATIVIERVLDILTILIILGFTLFLQPLPSYIKTGGLILFFLCCITILFLFFLIMKTDITIHFYQIITGKLPKKLSLRGEYIIKALSNGLIILKKRQYFFKITIITVGIWFFYIIIIQMLIVAFDFNLVYRVPVIACVTILVMSGISVSVPSSPGYIGTFHYLVMQSLVLYKVSDSEALSFAIVYHALNTIPVTILGFYLYIRQQINFQALISNKNIGGIE